ncbi:DUF4179 domain-containing protein [Cohnella abietis]|uniref:DUF5643 domain-containing protein n=1 Tax=Cohnella abietis TaxID=2507935 RepID=A0A3T1D2L4_9BACL|nr:DUF4179 domain-containing protein [Cohnella abietis]BBI32324.1 hypothetical protein KCTCHS21_17230 [Cohnella abietis]
MSFNELDTLLKDQRMATPSSVPPSVAKAIDEALFYLPDRHSLIQSTRRKRATMYWAASFAVLGCVIIASALYESRTTAPGSTIQEPIELTQATSIRALLDLESTGSPFRNFLKNDKSNAAIASVVDQGVTLTVRDVIYDGYELSVRYSVSSEKDIEGYTLDGDLSMDGRSIGKIGYIQSEESGQLEHYYEKLDSEHYEGLVRTWKLSHSQYRPESFHLKLEVSKVGSLTGKWSLDIPAKKTSDIIVINPDLSKSSELGTLSLRKVELSPVSTQLNYAFKPGKVDRKASIGIELTDDLGYPYGSVINRDYKAFTRLEFGPVVAGAKTLIVRSFYYDDRNWQKAEPSDYIRTPMLKQPTQEEPLVLSLGEAGEMYITGIEYLSDRTIVHSRFDSTVNGAFQIEDENGNSLPLLLWGLGGDVEFKPIPRDAQLTFLTRPTFPHIYIPELELRVDLPQ